MNGVGGPAGGGGKIGSPGAAGSDAVPDASRLAPADGATFRETVGRTESMSATTSASAVASPLDRLRAGEIDSKRYVELRVSDATLHLEGVLAPADLEKIRADLSDLIAEDPDVAALVKTAEIGR